MWHESWHELWHELAILKQQYTCRYCQLIFDGDQYEMRTSLNVTPRDGTEATVATPFKKHYNSQVNLKI